MKAKFLEKSIRAEQPELSSGLGLQSGAGKIPETPLLEFFGLFSAGQGGLRVSVHAFWVMVSLLYAPAGTPGFGFMVSGLLAILRNVTWVCRGN